MIFALAILSLLIHLYALGFMIRFLYLMGPAIMKIETTSEFIGGTILHQTWQIFKSVLLESLSWPAWTFNKLRSSN